jgi:PEP-CTERM motif
MNTHDGLRALSRSRVERSECHAGSPHVWLKRYPNDSGGKKKSGAWVRRRITLAAVLILIFGRVNVGSAGLFVFSTGNPDGKIATLSRTASAGKLETETADDFVTTAAATTITNATFTGLLVGGATTANIHNVEIELYHVFPVDSTNPPDGRVLTRVNSPSDNQFAAADGALGQLSFTTTVLNANFTAANSVVNGINAIPNQFTGGEGAVTGTEVQFNITLNTPFVLGPDHVFFRPEVDLGNAGDFLWLSAPKPIVAPGTPFASDLQSWIRNDGPGALAPDWERIGTDVTHQGPFNAVFSLTGTTVPEPSTLLLLGLGALVLLGYSQQWMAGAWKSLWYGNHG